MDNLILEKSKAFAIRSVNLYKHLVEEKHEYTLAKQILRSGTSIGANCREAARAQSRADFISKMNIALKEADESAYWLELLWETEYLTEEQYTSIYADSQELVKLLVSIIKTSKQTNVELRIKN
ncbi:MAG TPA: four helix bundle protein [Clostridiales bacterium]|nr:four helix bundle protein [Clostridiales bacterium]